MTMMTRWTMFALTLCIASAASAQYKYVDANGKVTYSDQPPPPNARAVAAPKIADVGPTSPLPFELQQATSKYPVTLYTGAKCAPCEEARSYLRGRGVPFTERSVTSDEDIALFKQQSPDGTAPVMQVGSRRSIGYAEPTWGAMLDEAGYPTTSKLPGDWQNPAPTPLSPTTRAASQNVAPPTQAARGPAATTPTPAPTSNAPPGFRF